VRLSVIDTHAHLDFKQFNKDRSQVINYALSNGVERIINIGVDLKSSRNSVKLAEQYDQIYAAVGFHPHDAKDLTDEALKELEKLAGYKKVVAIGEIGLDFYRNLSSPEVQIKAFKKQIDLAKRLKLPIVVHVRDAWNDAIKVLKESEAESVGGVLHSFSGSFEQAELAQSMGFHLSFNGMLTYPDSKTSQVAKDISLDSILVETDCPFLAPLPYRRKRNQPAYVKFVLQRLSELFSPLTFEDTERVTTLNACRLFKLGKRFTPKIAYPIRDSLYLNVTNLCSNACVFCVRNFTDFVKGHNLRLDHEPSYEEVIESLDHLEKYREVVFCGYGEPTIRLDLLKSVASYLKSRNVNVRLNTNGQGNLIHKRNIVPELVGLIDTTSISLNAENAEKYEVLCQPQMGDNVFSQVLAFAKECKELLPRTILTVLDMEEIDKERCEKIAKDLGVEFRIRNYHKAR
jgi:TatD DNase family protein